MPRSIRIEEGGRLDQVLAKLLPEISRRRAKKLIADGAVFVDGKRCKVASRMVAKGAQLVVHLEQTAALEKPFEILFEDEHAIAVNKHAGVHVNETETSAVRSLVEHLGAHNAMILRNHGLLACGASIPQAFNTIYWLEQACRIQVQTLSCQRPLHNARAEVVELTAEVLSGTEITLDNEAATNPHLKEDAQKAGSGYGLLEWPTLLRSLDRVDRSYQD